MRRTQNNVHDLWHLCQGNQCLDSIYMPPFVVVFVPAMNAQGTGGPAALSRFVFIFGSLACYAFAAVRLLASLLLPHS